MATPSSPSLLKGLSPSFWFLNLSQFMGAMNDNVFRWVMIWALVARASTSPSTLNTSAIFISGVIFAVPFILFSPLGGILADRFSKRRMIVMIKLGEVIVMVLGGLAFLSNSPLLIYAVLFLMTTQSALFGPNKFGILPEIVPATRLSHANGLMSGFSYLGIILGTAFGGLLVFWFVPKEWTDGASTAPVWRASAVCTGVAFVGFLLSLGIRETGVRADSKHQSALFWKAVARNLRLARSDRYLYLSLFAVAFFLFLGAFVQLNISDYGIQVLDLSKSQATYLFIAVALGIGLGSFIAGKMSGRTVEIGLTPLGALIVSAALLTLSLPVHNVATSVACLVVLGLGGGFYIVPLNTFLQQFAPKKDRGELIATASFLSFCGVALASALLFVMDAAGLEPPIRFFIFGCVTLVLSGFVVWTLPDFLIRFVGLIVTRMIYKLDVRGAENIPTQGGALLVCNHVSYADAALLMSTQQRRIRFVMDRHIYESRRLNWLFRLMQALPISRMDTPKEAVRSLAEAREAVDDGYLVCIFAEGSLTRTGYLNEFKKGFERVVKGSDRPIIPVNLHGVWGSILSYSEGEIFSRFPRPLRRRVLVSFGEPMPSTSTAFEVRQAVQQLHSEAFALDKQFHFPLPIEFARVARSGWNRFCMADSTGKRLTAGRTLVAAQALAAALRRKVGDEERIGLLLPTSAGGALANLAVAFMGKVSVNLNYTAAQERVDSAVEQSGISHVVTSREFLEKIGLENLPKLIYLEDIQAGLSRSDKIRAFLRARFLPVRMLFVCDRDEKRPTVDDVATVIFSSGSTATPKGVVLTHYNIIANGSACTQVFRLRPDTVFMGILPFFHSFGFTGTLWLPLLGGAPVVYHYSPLEAETIGKMVAKHKCTVLITTPTFLLAYIRKVKPEQFESLRIVVVGAEKLRARVAEAFEKRFGVTPMEGYGATELSPVASVNLPGVRAGDVVQEAHKPGTIGRPIPGVSMRIVDPEDRDRELPHGEEGLLLVKGPNVMQGYLNQPEKTAEAMQGDWYVTGDVAKIDHDGFVTITDRLSRFSKIGGEMVPHQAVEEALQQALGETQPVCAVTSVADEKKGERLVLLVTPEAGGPEEAHKTLKESDLPNLWKPARADVFEIEELPTLGTGKLDLKGIRELAEGKVAGRRKDGKEG